ncbi:hypothetical protein [Marinomonas atlantica]|uniref:hypothetical protein n=1 Tax=Marinomonas atlantica TaxID=1806668 RepID=UPI00082A93BC|nr:hypothetical protein [Marinomonas atlantica]
MSEVIKFKVLKAFRAGGKLVKEKSQISIGERLTKAEARALVSQGKLEPATAAKAADATDDGGKGDSK